MTILDLVLPAKPPPRLPLRRGRRQNRVAPSHFAMGGAENRLAPSPATVSYTQIPGMNAGDFFELFSSPVILFIFSFLGF